MSTEAPWLSCDGQVFNRWKCGRPTTVFYALRGSPPALDQVVGRCEAHRELGQETEGPELWRELSAAEVAAMEVHGG